jgi:uncharacterized protein YqiB (DUF1249 family)
MSRSLIDEGQGKCGLLKGLVPRVVVAKYEDNTLRNKKGMIQVQVCGRQRQRRRDFSNTSTLKKEEKVELKMFVAKYLLLLTGDTYNYINDILLRVPFNCFMVTKMSISHSI